MELKFTGKYVNFYEKHSDTVIAFFCKGWKCSKISEELEKEFDVKIPFQSLVNFYLNNKDYIDNCIEKKKLSQKDDLKEKIALEYCLEKAKELLFLLSEDLAEKVSSLEYDQQVKLIPTIMNTIAKLEGLDKSEININNTAFEDFFDEDIIQDALDDYYESTDEGSD